MSKKITGIIPPVITTFDKDGNFDESAQREVIRFLIDKVDGLFPTGTYGAGPMMSIEERKKVMDVIVDEVKGRIPVIFMVGAPSTRDAVDLAKYAEKIGADAVGAIPPYYNKYPDSSLLEYYRAIIKAVKMPVFLYNNPHVSNNNVSPAILRTLADEGLAGLKDSAFSLTTFYEFLLAVPPAKYPNFTHIVGTEAIAEGAVNAGAKAVISGLANCWPELMHDLWVALQAKDIQKSAEMQLKVYEARQALKFGPTLVVCYEVLKMRGVNAGYPRAPFMMLSDEIREKTRAEFARLGLFK
jgi:dihydrodipicolinate synthase/N-acetylneuraminate lyase